MGFAVTSDDAVALLAADAEELEDGVDDCEAAPVAVTVMETIDDTEGDDVLVGEVRQVSETRAVDDATTDDVAVNALDAVLSADGVIIDERDAIDEIVG